MNTTVTLLCTLAAMVPVVVSGYTDRRSRTVPNLCPLAILLLGLGTGGDWFVKVLGLILPPLLCFLAGNLLRQRSGGGDVKMYAALGFNLGFYLFILCLFLTFFILMILLRWKKVSRSETLPMCYYLAFAAGFCLLARAVFIFI